MDENTLLNIIGSRTFLMPLMQYNTIGYPFFYNNFLKMLYHLLLQIGIVLGRPAKLLNSIVKISNDNMGFLYHLKLSVMMFWYYCNQFNYFFLAIFLLIMFVFIVRNESKFTFNLFGSFIINFWNISVICYVISCFGMFYSTLNFFSLIMYLLICQTYYLCVFYKTTVQTLYFLNKLSHYDGRLRV